MKSLGLISQILTIGLSVAIVMMYIIPTFEEIGIIQTDIDSYKAERTNIEKVNNDLSQHLATIASISPRNVERIKTYMPPFVDDLGVMRDLQYIIEESGLAFRDVTYVGESAELNDEDSDEDLDGIAPVPYEFGIAAAGTYAQVKDFLSMLEQNEYPLEVRTIDIAPLDGGFLSIDAEIATYADIDPLVVE